MARLGSVLARKVPPPPRLSSGEPPAASGLPSLCALAMIFVKGVTSQALINLL